MMKIADTMNRFLILEFCSIALVGSELLLFSGQPDQAGP